MPRKILNRPWLSSSKKARSRCLRNALSSQKKSNAFSPKRPYRVSGADWVISPETSPEKSPKKKSKPVAGRLDFDENSPIKSPTVGIPDAEGDHGEQVHSIKSEDNRCRQIKSEDNLNISRELDLDNQYAAIGRTSFLINTEPVGGRPLNWERTLEFPTQSAMDMRKLILDDRREREWIFTDYLDLKARKKVNPSSGSAPKRSSVQSPCHTISDSPDTSSSGKSYSLTTSSSQSSSSRKASPERFSFRSDISLSSQSPTSSSSSKRQSMLSTDSAICVSDTLVLFDTFLIDEIDNALGLTTLKCRPLIGNSFSEKVQISLPAYSAEKLWIKRGDTIDVGQPWTEVELPGQWPTRFITNPSFVKVVDSPKIELCSPTKTCPKEQRKESSSPDRKYYVFYDMACECLTTGTYYAPECCPDSYALHPMI